MICVSIAPTSFAELKTDFKKAARFSRLIELRADRLPAISFNRLPVLKNTKLIFTIRPCRRLGGFFRGNESTRIKLLQSAIDSNRFDYVDADHTIFNRLQRRPRQRTKIIVSYHNFQNTPANLTAIYQKLKKLNPDAIKITTMARDITDNLKIFRLRKYANKRVPLTAFCMGEDGLISRVLYRKFGFWLTYAALEPRRSTAPGQLTCFDLKHLYRADRLNRRTKIFGLIGNRIEHSLSPLFFNTLFQRRKINAAYLPFRLKTIKPFRPLTDFLGVRGYSVTNPYKISVIPYLKKLTPAARQIGAVNTVWRKTSRPGVLIGDNTDYLGAWRAIKQTVCSRYPRYAYQGKTALIIGAGGAARAIAFALQQAGLRLLFLNRRYLKSKQIARDFKGIAINLSQLSRIKTTPDVIINATPLGSGPYLSITPFPEKFLRPGMIVFDAVYHQPQTRLLREAERKGCLPVSGLSMFLNQARAQYKLFMP